MLIRHAGSFQLQTTCIRDSHLSTSMCIQIHAYSWTDMRMPHAKVRELKQHLCWKLCFWCGSPWFQQRLRFRIYILWAANHSEKYQDSACRHWDAFGWAAWTAVLLTRDLGWLTVVSQWFYSKMTLRGVKGPFLTVHFGPVVTSRGRWLLVACAVGYIPWPTTRSAWC